jgi:hypothetical protein
MLLQDHTLVLEQASACCYTSVPHLEQRLNWLQPRAAAALDFLVNEGVCACVSVWVGWTAM